MKITIISYDNWGLNKKLVNFLKNEKKHEVIHIDFHSFKYKYSSVFSKIYNFILKTFFQKNLKNIYYGDEILKILKTNDKQDLILTIKGDFIDINAIKQFKNYSKKSIAFFNDSSTRCPKIKKVHSYFDKSFSFEKDDCKNYNMHFLTNWIYTNSSNTTNYTYQISNVSSMDKRFNLLNNLSIELSKLSIKYKFIVLKNKKNYKSTSLDIIDQKLSLEEINKLNNESETLLDINRENQEGLSFRIFESLGYKKKLITTNKDIMNYDFYNPKNIYVIDKKFPKIDASFFKEKYEDIPTEILEKYTMNGWFNKITS